MKKSQWYTTVIIMGIVFLVIANLDTEWAILGFVGLILLFAFVLLTRKKYL
ncbi:hypothetical protein [Paenibacillus sp. L3-i20]|uniref:hypothetical protein n=1 Tax=Paenibacillus sp. L3-i20 TaxID=2905833 RepID=UPI001EDF4672|nr:hypothetical protein [Paenibacillus sp. L3-i20]GKU76438.1 hypothetical protein L3i20_v208350 [Paenibacillus sp. L3-i20]